MAESVQVEKRARKRLLCSDHFSGSTVKTDGQSLTAQSINYNRYGIGLFAMSRLPEVTRCLLSFRYNNGESDINIQDVNAELVYANETEVGQQYGFKFCMDEISETVKADLGKLETLLEQDAKSDRYGLFS